MTQKESVTFIIPVSNDEVYKNSFLTSSFLKGKHCHQIITQKNFLSASQAYNKAIDISKNDLLVFLHQDIYLPESWMDDLDIALKYLDANDPNWGVLGCFGVNIDGIGKGYLYSNGLGSILGSPFEHPEPVQTLDECILIIRKSSGLRFDNSLPYFHLYGTDICMRAASLGMKCYVMSAFCIHNSRRLITLPKEFYKCYDYIKKHWGHSLPIHTSCIKITKYTSDIYKRWLKDVYIRKFKKHEMRNHSQNPERLLKEIRARYSISK